MAIPKPKRKYDWREVWADRLYSLLMMVAIYFTATMLGCNPESYAKDCDPSSEVCHVQDTTPSYYYDERRPTR